MSVEERACSVAHEQDALCQRSQPFSILVATTAHFKCHLLCWGGAVWPFVLALNKATERNFSPRSASFIFYLHFWFALFYFVISVFLIISVP